MSHWRSESVRGPDLATWAAVVHLTSVQARAWARRPSYLVCWSAVRVGTAGVEEAGTGRAMGVLSGPDAVAFSCRPAAAAAVEAGV